MKIIYIQRFCPGDLVLVINSLYNPDIIGNTGTVMYGENYVFGEDRNGQLVSGTFVIVDLPGNTNSFGNTLWYLKPEHLIKINPDKNAVEDPDTDKIQLKNTDVVIT